ncbi:MAG TPA: hypothetical protein VIE66_04350 [Methylocella sp.]
MAGEQPDQQLMEAAQAIALQTHAKELGEIIELGRTEFGTGNFDDASQIVADKLGPRTQEAVAMLRQFDFPHRLVAELANAPEKLEKLAKMPAGRLAAELARIESRMTSNGHAITGADPAWKGPTVRGRVSDADWKKSFGEGMSEAAFDKEFRRRQAGRAARRR